MASRIPGNPMERFLSLRVRPLMLFCALFVVISLGIMAINAVSDATDTLRSRLTDLRIERDRQYKAYKQLEYELSNIQTDEYIRAKARQEYGYMMPQEIRFVITNYQAMEEDTEEPLHMTVTEVAP